MERVQESKQTAEFQPFKVSFWASLGNTVADLIFYPWDTINTRFKANKQPNPPLLKYIPYVFKVEGISSLYKGAFSTPLWSSFFPHLIYLFLYEIFTKKVSDYTKNQPPVWSPFLIGCASEAGSLTILVPADIIRTRIQANSIEYQYKGFFDGLRKVIKKEGIYRLYRSSEIYMLCMTIQAGVLFQSFEMFRDFYGHSVNLSLINTVLSTTIASLICNPLDVLITRVAITDTSRKKVVYAIKIEKIWKREGINGFFKGTTPKIICSIGYNLLWMPIYDYFRSLNGSKMQ